MGVWDAADEPEDGPADPRGSGRGRFAAGTPEDVAALYTWANLQGARYRDFSASRRRYREQVRAQAAGGAKAQAEAPGEAAVPEQRPAVPAKRELGTRSLEERRRGGSAIRWAAGRRGWESSSRSLGREQLEQAAGRAAQIPAGHEDAAVVSPAAADAATDWRRAGEPAAVDPHGDDPLYRSAEELWPDGRWQRVEPTAAEVDESFANALRGLESDGRRSHGAAGLWEKDAGEQEPEFPGPAWLYGGQRQLRQSWPETRGEVMPMPSAEPATEPFAAPSGEALGRDDKHRWCALREALGTEWIAPHRMAAGMPSAHRAPLLLVFSLAGGVGRTSLMASLGRALSANGERVMLGDAAAYSLLPFYFGGQALPPGETRAFAPPEGSEDSPVFMVNYDLTRAASDPQARGQVVSEILRSGAECQRILLDLPASAEWLLRRLATLQPAVLVPLLPDLGSVVSLENIERYFERFSDADGNPVLPFYVLSQFDPALKLHLDAREMLRARLGERLLSFAIRRSEAVSEALAEGTTVADYAPESAVTGDYFEAAAWLRTISPPVMAAAARSGKG